MPRGLRSSLFQLLVLCALPLGLSGAGLLYFHWQAQELERERAQLQTTRLLAAAVDNALDSSIQRLAMLAGNWGNPKASASDIYDLAKAAMPANTDWSLVRAYSASGRAVFRTDQPNGTRLASLAASEDWAPVLRGVPVVSNLVRGTDIHSVSVGVPVVRNGIVTHLLLGTLKLAWLDELVSRLGPVQGGSASVFDRNFKVVAHSAQEAQRHGADAGTALREAMQARVDGTGRFPSPEIGAAYTAWAKTRHGWTVAVATPAEPIDGAFRRHLLVFACLWAAVVIAGSAYAYARGRPAPEDEK